MTNKTPRPLSPISDSIGMFWTCLIGSFLAFLVVTAAINHARDMGWIAPQ